MDSIRQVHAASYGTYGHRRVHPELVLGHGERDSHGRVERLMRHTGLQGVHRRRLRGCTRRDQAGNPSADLVDRRFDPTEPDRLSVADITQHPTGGGLVSPGHRHRLLQPPRRGLGHGRSHPHRAGRRRVAHGGVAPAAR